jgi:VWFA-related protein
MHPLRRADILPCCLLVIMGWLASPSAAAPPAAPQDQPPPPAATVDIFVTSPDGRPVDTLRPSDLTVSINGQPRRIQWLRRVSRGPGALADATARLARGSADLGFVAESSRSFVVVIDQASFISGYERQAIEAGKALVDRMGIADRVAVLRLPFSPDQQVVLTTERPPLRDSLQRTAGLLARPRPGLTADAPMGTDGAVLTQDPDAPPASSGGHAAATAGRGMPAARGSLAGLTALFNVLRTLPGRKTLTLVSAGLFPNDARQLAETAALAVASGVTVYVVELPALRDATGRTPDVAPLRELAAATGGFSIAAGRSADKAAVRVAADLGACFTVGVELAAGDPGEQVPAVRVTSARADLVVRSASWLRSGPPPDDAEPAAPPAAAATPSGTGAPVATPTRGDPMLDVILARAQDYVDAYESSYSALVAEEEYVQSSGQRSVRLKSDLLLVKSEGSEPWACFRDVFEADGKPVRDREDRLKKLFLEPGVQADAQLRMIKDEGARYNIGPVLRNTNVPLFALMFLERKNRERVQFKVSRHMDAAGVAAIRLEFRETGRPTVISRDGVTDLPSAGWFTIEEATGAVIESGLTVSATDFQAEIRVRYRTDPGLGLWVPAEMREMYRTLRRRGLTSMLLFDTSMEGKAKYAKFRRFQVQTEETIAEPKKD